MQAHHLYLNRMRDYIGSIPVPGPSSSSGTLLVTVRVGLEQIISLMRIGCNWMFGCI